jgi:hypothetical protein
MGFSNSAGIEFMVSPPVSFPRCLFQIESVTVAGIASSFFQSGDLSPCSQSKYPAYQPTKFDCNALMCMSGGTVKRKPARSALFYFDDLDWRRRALQ